MADIHAMKITGYIDEEGAVHPVVLRDGLPVTAAILNKDLISRGLVEGADRISNLAMLESCIAPVDGVRQKATIWPWAAQQVVVGAGPSQFTARGAGPLYYHPVYPSVATSDWFVVSTSEQDKHADNGGGSGSGTIHLHYLDGDYKEWAHVDPDTGDPAVITIKMNGTTPVRVLKPDGSPAPMLRVNKVAVKDTKQPVGDILVVGAADGAYRPLYNGIPYGRYVSFSGFFTVPAGKRGMLSRWTAAANAMGDNTHFCWVALAAKQNCLYQPHDNFIGFDSVSLYNSPSGDMTFDPPMRIAEKIDVRFTAEADIGAGFVTAAWHGWLELDE